MKPMRVEDVAVALRLLRRIVDETTAAFYDGTDESGSDPVLVLDGRVELSSSEIGLLRGTYELRPA